MEYRTDRTEKYQNFRVRFFDIFSASKPRTELQLSHQTDVELPDSTKKSKDPQNYRIDRTDRLDRPTARTIESIAGRRGNAVVSSSLCLALEPRLSKSNSEATMFQTSTSMSTRSSTSRAVSASTSASMSTSMSLTQKHQCRS